ncbi:MAG: acyl-CoA dehydrogenase family protein [Acidimicrobiales bacterium]
MTQINEDELSRREIVDSELLRKTLKRFVSDRVAPLDAAADRDGRIPAEWWQQISELDLTGLLVPAEHGGAEADVEAAAIVAEELAAGSAALAWTFLEHTDAAWILADLASDEKKARLLSRLCSGELIGAGLKITEAGGGSDNAAILTTAVATGDGYVLNGRKVFQSLAGTADLYLVVARTEPVPDSGALSVFVVEADNPGISFGSRERTVGLRALSVGEIIFEDCRVSAHDLVGPPGGFRAVIARHGRVAPILVASIALGLAEASLSETIAFVNGREVAGKPLADVPAVQLRVADLLIELEATRGLVERAIRGTGSPALGILAKVGASEAAARVIDGCLKLHGALGYSTELPIERRARDVRALALHFGTNDQLRAIAARIAFAT